MDEVIFQLIDEPKTMEPVSFYFPQVGEAPYFASLWNISDGDHLDTQFQLIRASQSDGTDELTDYWHVNLAYLHNGERIFGVDYGVDWDGHHFRESHVHVGKDAFLLDSDVVFQCFPNLAQVSYRDSVTDDVIMNTLEDAIYGFLMTCNVQNIDEVGLA